MKELIKAFLTSKKAIATLVAVMVWVLGRFGLDIDEAQLLPLVGAIAAFVLAQGFADSGKEAAKIASAALESKAAPKDPPSAPSP